MMYGAFPYLCDPHDEYVKDGEQRSKSRMMQKAIATNKVPPTYVAEKGLRTPSKLARAFVERLLLRCSLKRPSATKCLLLPAMNLTSNVDKPTSGEEEAASLLPTIQLARQRTIESKTWVDPTVAKTMDELIEQLQKRFRGADTGDWANSFSLPVVNSAPSSGFHSRSISHDGKFGTSSWLIGDNISECSTTASAIQSL